MATDNLMKELVCNVCDDHYLAGSQDPLTLSCGHTFCRRCLVKLEIQQVDLTCPNCRFIQLGLPADSLPPNYAILSLLDVINRTVKSEKCISHPGEELAYWCQKCECLVCGLCICQIHRQEPHIIVSEIQARKEKRARVEQEAAELEGKVDAKLKSSIGEALCQWLQSIKKLSALLNMKKTLGQTTEVLKSGPGMEDLVACQLKLQGLNITTSSSASENSPQISPVSPDYMSFSRNIVISPMHVDTSPTSTLAEYFKDIIPTQDILKTECYVQYGDKLWGRLVGEGDNIFLHSFSSLVPENHFTLNWQVLSSYVPMSNCQVFLDLSADEHNHLGRVIIQPWVHLRRAKHFMGLCLGVWGNSFKYTDFIKVFDTDFCQFLVSDGYRSEASGLKSSIRLIGELEWDGEFSGPDRMGQIVGFGGGQVSLDSIFGICVMEKANGGRSRCPFAQVVRGIEVVRKAASLVPSSSVTIVECGLVFNIGRDAAEGGC